MTNRSLLKSAVFGCLLTTSLGYGIAIAKEPTIYFYPSKKWEVAPVSGQPSSMAPSCTISNEFNNGYVIQLAGNASGFTNINIDFRQDIFEQDKQYTAKLSVPGIDEEKIQAQAFKKSLLVSDLRKHDKFSKALVEASVLDFTVEGNEFRFYMTGLTAAMTSFDVCTGGDQAPAQVAKAETQGKEELPPAEKLKYVPEIEESGIKKAADKEKPVDIAPPPPLPEKAPEEAPPEQEPVIKADKKGSAKPDIASRERYTEKLASEMKGDSKSYAAKESPKPKAEEILATPIAKEAVEPPPAEEPPPPPPPQRENIKSPKAETKVTKHEKIEVDLTKAEEPENMPAIEDVKEVKPNNSVPADTFIDMRNKIAELEKKVVGLKAENTALSEDLEETLKDTREERMSVSSDNWNLEKATMRFNESERQVARLGRQLQTMKAQCDTEKMKLEGMLFDPQVTNQQQLSKLSALEGELEAAKDDLATQKRMYEERIKLLEERLGKP